MENYYLILGIPAFSPLEDVQTAYNRQFGELFVSESPLANLPRMKLLKEALEILSDPVRREEYDARLKTFLESLEKKFGDAVDRLSEGKFDEAIALLRECLKINPREPDFYETLGLAFQLRGTLDEALKAFQQGLQLKSKNAQFNWYIADIYRQMRDDERFETYLLDAAEGFKEILKTDPRNVHAQEMLADCYGKMRFFDEAVEVYNKLIEMFPYKAEYRRDLGALLYEMDCLDDAQESLVEALRNAPEDASSYLYLGLVYYKKRLLAWAIQNLDESLKRNPQQPEVRSLLEKIREVQKDVGRTVEEIINDPTPDAMVEGSVKWYNSETGIGVLSCPEYAEVLLHYTALKPEDVDALKKGDAVRFGVVKDQVGLIAVQVERLEDGQVGDTLPGKISKFDHKRKLGMISVPDGREIMFTFAALSGELAADKLEIGLDVLFDAKTIRGLNDDLHEQAMNVRPRKKPTVKPIGTPKGPAAVVPSSPAPAPAPSPESPPPSQPPTPEPTSEPPARKGGRKPKKGS